MSTSTAAGIAAAFVVVLAFLALGVDWRNECERVGLVRNCVATGQHEETTMQLVSVDADGIPLFMPMSVTVTDYDCKCEARDGE